MPRSLITIETTSTPHTTDEEGHITLQHFSAQLWGRDAPIGKTDFSLAYPDYQDVIDVLFYAKKDGEFYVATNASLRPVLYARAEMLGENPPHDLLHREGIGVIYNLEKGDISIVDAVKRAAKEKVGCEIDPESIHVGNPYYPSIGVSGEACIPCFCRVSTFPKQLDTATYGQAFEGERHVTWMKIVDIIAGRHRGDIDDLRVVFLSYLFAYQHQIELPSDDVQQISLDTQSTISSSLQHIESVSAMKHFLMPQVKKDPHVELVAGEQPTDPFIAIHDIQVTNTYEDKTIESYTAQMSVRKGRDSADVCSYYMEGEKLYLAMKYSLRPSLLARNFQPHYIHTNTHPWQCEGISISCDSAIASAPLSDRASMIAPHFSQKITFAGTKPMQYLGGYFPSVGNSAEYVHLCMQQIEPMISHATGERGNLYPATILGVECDTVIDGYLHGYIADPRVVLQALVLRHMARYENPYTRPVTQKDRELFQEVLHQPLQVDAFMKHAAELKGEAIYQLHVAGKKYSTWYRRLVSYVEQELGGFLGERDWLLSDTDKSFFSAMLPMFAVPSEELMEKYINYITHDQGHYLQGDIIPYDPTSDTRMDKAHYVRYMSWTEANAVFDSDVLYPEQMGLERFEKIIGGESVATSFHALGIYDNETIRTMIIQIERDGYIPDEIMQHPAYEHARKNIIARLLRFHYMDKTQAAAQYDQWKTIPHVAKTALRFCRTISDLTAFEERMDSYHAMIEQYDEGVNPIKAYVARLNVKYIDMFALHLAYYLQSVDDAQLPGCESEMVRCTELLQILEKHQSTVAYLHDHIVGISSHESAIKTVRYAHDLYIKLQAIHESYMQRVAESTYITSDRSERLLGSRVPYFVGFAPMSETMHDEILAIEKENLARIGR